MHQFHQHNPRHRAVAPPKTRRRLALALPAAGLVIATAMSGFGTSNAATTSKVYFGVDGASSKAARTTPLSDHMYSQYNLNPPNARMLTMGNGNLSWNSVAGAKPGSSVYNDFVRWADVLKARPGPTLLTFSHEPEASGQKRFGNAAGFIAAWRHVVDIFRAQGVKNVQWTWQMTAYSFKVGNGDPRAASKWYPGDAYVDNVAGDAYNWSTCHGGAVQQLSTVASGLLAFARAHHKGAVLGEYGTGTGAARVPWLRNAAAFLVQNANTFRGAYYFDHPNGTGCNWGLTSSTDVNTFVSLSKDPHFTR
jgi:Glycosyl hydrolase family 26